MNIKHFLRIGSFLSGNDHQANPVTGIRPTPQAEYKIKELDELIIYWKDYLKVWQTSYPNLHNEKIACTVVCLSEQKENLENGVGTTLRRCKSKRR